MKSFSIFLIPILFLNLLSCKKETDGKIVSGYVDGYQASLEPYIDAFKDSLVDAGLAPDFTGLTVVFTTDLASNILGTCYRASKLVKINQTLWSRLTPGDREELIFHELGHCILYRDHNLTTVSGIPVSIMYPYHLGSIYTQPANYGGYLAELFSVPLNLFAAANFVPGFYAASTLALEGENYIEPLNTDEILFRCGDED